MISGPLTPNTLERMRHPNLLTEIDQVDSIADQLACEMFAEEPTSSDDRDLKHELVAAHHLKQNLFALLDGLLDIPVEITAQPDRLEDWLLSRTAEYTYRDVGIYPVIETVSADPTIAVLESELAMHGPRTPYQAMHKWGD